MGSVSSSSTPFPAVRGGLLPGDHRDPFDRLIAAQAIVHGYAVVTPDAVFAKVLGAEVFW